MERSGGAETLMDNEDKYTDLLDLIEFAQEHLYTLRHVLHPNMTAERMVRAYSAINRLKSRIEGIEIELNAMKAGQPRV